MCRTILVNEITRVALNNLKFLFEFNFIGNNIFGKNPI